MLQLATLLDTLAQEALTDTISNRYLIIAFAVLVANIADAADL